MGTLPGGRAASRAYSAVVYVLLFVLGGMQGLIGSFQYSQSPAPLIALFFVVVIFATCVLCSWGIQSAGGALAPAGGWLAVSFILSTGTHEGSVIITNTTAGQCFLYGGTVAALLGAATSLVLRAHARSRLRL